MDAGHAPGPGAVMGLRGWASALLMGAGMWACSSPEPRVGVSITGLDHLAETLSIQEFSVDGQGAAQAGRGGSKVCCASIPAHWRPGLTVKVRWSVTNWPAKVYSDHERDVPVEKYDEVGSLYVHFLRDGSVRVLSSPVHPINPAYPGPSFSTVLRTKEPWKLYKGNPGDPEFTQVDNAMEAR